MNLCSGGTAGADAYYNATYAPAKAIDGSLTTYWSSGRDINVTPTGVWVILKRRSLVNKIVVGMSHVLNNPPYIYSWTICGGIGEVPAIADRIELQRDTVSGSNTIVRSTYIIPPTWLDWVGVTLTATRNTWQGWGDIKELEAYGQS